MSWLRRLLGQRKRQSPIEAAASDLESPRHDPYRIVSMDDLWNHIAYVRAYAPDHFRVEDFLRPEEQMTLERAFKLLRDGVWVAYPEDQFADKRQWLFDALDRALAAYRDGDDVIAATILQTDFEDAIFKGD